MKLRPLFAIGVLTSVALLLYVERRFPLRTRMDPGARRIARNSCLAGLSGLVVRIAERPLVAALSRQVSRRQFGLAQLIPVSPAWRDVIAIILMDYSLYGWHVLMHRSDALYRLHQVHHSDLDLDATTALRFHFAEMLASVPWRVLQIGILGVSPRALLLWQRFTGASVLFHHSNLRLSPKAERILQWLIATPRLHEVHHSISRGSQDSNWSSGLTIWDRLHGTFRRELSPGRMQIGVPRYRMRDQVTLGKLLRMPGTSAALARRALDN